MQLLVIKPWASLLNNPPTQFPSVTWLRILCVGEGGFEYLYQYISNYEAFKNSICVKSQQLSLRIIYRPLNYHYN